MQGWILSSWPFFVSAYCLLQNFSWCTHSLFTFLMNIHGDLWGAGLHLNNLLRFRLSCYVQVTQQPHWWRRAYWRTLSPAGAFLVLFLGMTTAPVPLHFVPLPDMVGVLKLKGVAERNLSEDTWVSCQFAECQWFGIKQLNGVNGLLWLAWWPTAAAS